MVVELEQRTRSSIQRYETIENLVFETNDLKKNPLRKKEDIIIPETKPTNLRYNKASYNREA